MSGGVTLPNNILSNLTSLQNISSQLGTVQNHLSTGKKVNSALDNPTSYSLSQSLNNRSSSLSGLLDGMSNGVQTIQAANSGAQSIVNALNSIKGIISQATAIGSSTTSVSGSAPATGITGASGDKLTLTNTATNSVLNIDISSATSVQDVINSVNTNSGGAYTASLSSSGTLPITASGSNQGAFTAAVTNGGTVSAKNTGLLGGASAIASSTTGGPTTQQLTSFANQINDLMDSITKTVSDSDYAGTNLLQNGSSMSVQLSEKGTSTETVQGQDLGLTGLGLTKFAAPASVTMGQITGLANALTAAASTASSYQTQLSTSLSVLQNRQTFTNSMMNILQTGSGNLVNADMNQEASTLQALNTRQSLAQSALSLSNQANQGVLQLLR